MQYEAGRYDVSEGEMRRSLGRAWARYVYVCTISMYVLRGAERGLALWVVLVSATPDYASHRLTLPCADSLRVSRIVQNYKIAPPEQVSTAAKPHRILGPDS